MTLTIELSPEQEARLNERARATGVNPAEFMIELLDREVAALEGPRPDESLLDGLKRIGVFGAVKGTTRPDGRPWSEVEGFE